MGTEQVSAGRRAAGQHAQAQADRIRVGMLAFLGAVALLLAGAFLRFGGRGPALVAIEAVLVLGIVLTSRHFGDAFDRWSRGAAGERKIGALLEQLAPEGWHVLHDVSLGRGNIDHVLVGPGGTFTVETKSHRGSRRVENLHGSMLRQAYAEKKLLETVSGLKVEPLLVFSEGWLIGRLPARRKGVTILPARMLVGHLKRRPTVMSATEAAEIGERLRLALEEDA